MSVPMRNRGPVSTFLPARHGKRFFGLQQKRACVLAGCRRARLRPSCMQCYSHLDQPEGCWYWFDIHVEIPHYIFQSLGIYVLNLHSENIHTLCKAPAFICPSSC